MLNNHTSKTIRTLIKELRSLMPHRPLTFIESCMLAERQANYALQLAEQTHPDVDLGWILCLPRVEVQLEPRYKMDSVSGFTTFTHGRYLIMVNKNDTHTERRYTLAHELKHLLDYTAGPVIHRSLGFGDRARQDQEIEQICDHFADCLLMPRMWLKRAWSAKVQDPSALAGMFTVSEEAMDARLKSLGFIDDGPRPLRSYFRRPELVAA